MSIINDENGAFLWDRQPWDTETSYARFYEHYFTLAPPRHLINAYRNYQRSKGKNPAQYRRVPGSWLNWAAGKDNAGNPIAGAVSWQQRMIAYDRYIAEQAAEEDIRSARIMRRAFQRTIAEAQEKIDEAVKAVDPKNLTPNELSRFLAVVFSASMDVYDMRPPERKGGEDRAMFDLEAWAEKRQKQLAPLEEEEAAAGDDDNLSF